MQSGGQVRAARQGAMTNAMVAYAESGARALRVAVVRDGRIERELTLRGRLRVGPSEHADLTLGASRRELFVEEGGAWILRHDGTLSGRLATGDGLRRLEQLSAGEIRLGPDARGRIEVDGHSLLFQLVMPRPAMPTPALPASVRGGWMRQIDWPFTASAALMFMSFFAGLVVLENADWPVAQALLDDNRVAALVFEPPPDPPPPAAHWAQHDPETLDPERLDDPEPEPQPEPVTDAVARNDRPSRDSAPRQDDAPPSLDDVRDEVSRNLERLFLGTNLAGGDSALVNALAGGQDTSDLAQQFATADGVGSVAGNDRMRIRDTRCAGDECGRDGDDLGTLRPAGPTGPVAPTAPVEERSIIARLPPGEFDPYVPNDFDDRLVLRRVRGKQRAIQRCYERQLTQGSPDLQGRVAVELTIMPAGNVRARVRENGTGDEALGQCMVRALNGIRFAQGPEYEVEYGFPFVFAPQR